MSFNVSRQVVIDDSDPRIQWTGDWFTRSSVGQVGRWSAPVLNTLHGFNGTSASLSFSYHGSGVLVTGSLTPSGGLGPGPAPFWQCLVDDIVVGNSSRVNWSVTSDRLLYLCGPGPLLLDNHTLQINFSDGTGIVWVDTIEYRVPAAVYAGVEWTRVSYSDERITYSIGWEVDANNTLTWTYAHGAWLTYDFVGEGVTFSGYIPSNSAVPGMGYYILDGQEPPQSFVIPATGSESLSNYAFIDITGLNPGPHHLEVRNGGNETTAALGLRSILTRDTSSPSSKPPKDSQTSGKIIGGVVGGGLCVVILLIILALLLWRRRKRRREPPIVMNQEESLWPVSDGQTGGTTMISTGEMSQRPNSLPTPTPPTPGPRPPAASPEVHNSMSTPESNHALAPHTPAGRTDHEPGMGAQAR